MRIVSNLEEVHVFYWVRETKLGLTLKWSEIFEMAFNRVFLRQLCVRHLQGWKGHCHVFCNYTFSGKADFQATLIKNQVFAWRSSITFWPRDGDQNPCLVCSIPTLKPLRPELEVSMYSLVQWNWLSAVTECTWVACIQSRSSDVREPISLHQSVQENSFRKNSIPKQTKRWEHRRRIPRFTSTNIRIKVNCTPKKILYSLIL